MAYQKKQYRNGTKRGGSKGQCVDTGFGAAGNKHRTKKRYPGDLFKRNPKEN
jgi:hypothetical protein